MTFINLFPASPLTHLFIYCSGYERDSKAFVQQTQRTNFESFEFQWWLVKVHQSPAPTHPLSRGSHSQWKLLAPEWEAGFSSEKKKNLTTPYFLYLATTGNTLQLKALHTARLLFDSRQSWRADRQNDRQTNPCAWNQSFTMTAKNTAEARACAVQTSTATTRQGWVLKICTVSKLAGTF